ncbi:hypothetical protein MTR_8g079290 [Medicago truncatula]|uniref:Uncharacterized protein n=1 Tax=Medicago truncatula TaxID=3880 RepID=G7LFN3_MEDTR|nr:hypothetical protein MTR_8g079290 [Medicago truncatula]
MNPIEKTQPTSAEFSFHQQRVNYGPNLNETGQPALPSVFEIRGVRGAISIGFETKTHLIQS